MNGQLQLYFLDLDCKLNQIFLTVISISAIASGKHSLHSIQNIQIRSAGRQMQTKGVSE